MHPKDVDRKANSIDCEEQSDHGLRFLRQPIFPQYGRTSLAPTGWDHENKFYSKIVPASQGKFLHL